jgi:translocation and assembly module TamA
MTRSMNSRFLLLLTLLAMAGSALGQDAGPAPLISISGASAPLEANIRSLLSIDSERCDADLFSLEGRRAQVRREVERAAQGLGFYRLTQQLRFGRNDTCWTLQIDVVPGEPVLFGDIAVRFAGAQPQESAPFEALLASSPVVSGAPLNHRTYENLKSALSALAVENGYFSARFSRSELAIDLARNRADVHIDFDPGPRFAFGTINITPISELSDRFISRFVPFASGSPYSTEALVELRESLNNSQYFRDVAVTPQLTAAQTSPTATVSEVPVNITLQVRPRRSWTAGLGVTTDNGPRMTVNYEDRYFNRSGHRQNGDISLSTMENRANISHIIPMADPATESLSVSLGYVGQDNDTYSIDTYKLGVSYRSTIDIPLLGDEWLQNIFSNFQRENSALNTVAVDGHESSNLTITGINWTKTAADDPIFPTRGWRLFTQVSGASNAFVSDLSFLQLYASGKFVHSIGPGRALVRMEAATTFVDGLSELPVSIRYFTGGDQSVRGYQFGSLGALNELGEVIGGKHLLTGSAEYDFTVRPNWKMAVFMDAGNSFTDLQDFSLYKSAGLGLRWMSPIGPIRADIAKGLDDGSFRLHITMGPDL